MKDAITIFMVVMYTAVGCFGALPQIYKTFKTKKVEDLSKASWLMWSVSSISYLLYACAVNPTFELIFTSVLDTALNIIIIVQIFYYSKRQKRIAAVEEDYLKALDTRDKWLEEIEQTMTIEETPDGVCVSCKEDS